MRTINYLVIHYTGAAASQSVDSILAYWKQAHPDWMGVPGYHILISADGSATRLRPDEQVSYGVAGFNANSLHVCFTGDGPFTAAQEATLEKRVRYWHEQHPLARICGHRDLSPDRNHDGRITPDEWVKNCPGFDVATWWARKNAPTVDKVDAAGRAFLTKEEGERLNAYRDAGGVLTIGVGHTGPDVRAGQCITAAESQALLSRDLGRFETAVAKLVTVPLRQNQFNALVSFCFNLGEGALGKSSLLRLVNSGVTDPASLTNAFALWRNVNSVPNAAIEARRRREAALYLN